MFNCQRDPIDSLDCGGIEDRRTVVGREGPIFAGLEFYGLFDLPHRVSTNKSASYGFPWNRTGNFWAHRDPFNQPARRSCRVN